MPKRFALNLLPCPRSLKILRGTFTLPKQGVDLILGSARAPRAVFSALAEHTNTAAIRVTKIATDGASVATREGACAPQNQINALFRQRERTAKNFHRARAGEQVQGKTLWHRPSISHRLNPDQTRKFILRPWALTVFNQIVVLHGSLYHGKNYNFSNHCFIGRRHRP